MNFNNKCIYCFGEINSRSKSRHSVEHVIPKMLGLFKSNNMTLTKEVCAECNKFFSKGIEFSFGRDSTYGILYRSLAGIFKNQQDFSESIRKKIKKLQIKAHHPILGLVLVNIQQDPVNIFSVRLADQFLFFNSTKGLKVCFPINELPHKSVLDSMGLPVYTNEVIFFGARVKPDEIQAKAQLIKNKLETAEIKRNTNAKKVNIYMPLSGEEPLLFGSHIDDEIIRVIAKIGFNYFVYIFGAIIAQGEHFNVIRNYIRYGQKPTYDLVIMNKRPINLRVDNFTKVSFTSHEVSIITEQKAIKARIQLFNNDMFDVLLAQNYPVFLPIKLRGHYFDLLTRSIIEI